MMIGIIGAMEQEVTLLASMITNPQETQIAGVRFIEGSLENQSVVLLRSGVGKVQAAMATTLLHEHFKPTTVINIGSAGGLISGMEIGDIIISDEAAHHDVDLTPIGLAPATLPGLPQTFPSDPALMALVKDVLTELKINSQIGLIATGDAFIADQVRVETIKNTFPNVKAVEMEAAAIAQVCYLYQTPFIVIRALSDLPDKEMPMSFVEYLDFAAKNSANIVLQVLAKIAL
ncbi:MAG TPA: 5'-methylthioadenosine/adenosylhomocysteine nucleosidase [Candidatus Ignatzschineria merdigallinarum]|uniref:5'-methylthioadenosine/S-adenosylhomocysteine nucleosidase n=1 Tax=Candidatus Ignatzschineria merdigallinarum TaxID=2838621 RepID=A0A9D1TTQ8_9GAMM|nr:5'-methylthioadenosine/adenosylhomocysteine nucleosidase [Candidatus Ignatzschineria merdigallinarum]